MLLNCGHDMCKNCLKFLFKRNRQVICEICQTDSMYEIFSDNLYQIILKFVSIFNF